MLTVEGESTRMISEVAEQGHDLGHVGKED